MNNTVKVLSSIFAMVLLTASGFTQTLPPKAEVRNVTDEYFGHKVTDPYRWMEDLNSDETKSWMRSQADYAAARLSRLPLRGEILKELNSITDQGVRVSGIQHRGNLYFYYRIAPGDADASICVREGVSGEERILVDAKKLGAGSERRSAGWFSVSQDGKYISYLSSAGGSEESDLRVIETATGKDTGVSIDRTKFNSGAWLPDGKSFLYHRQLKLGPGDPPTEKYRKSRIYLHILGTDPEKDRPVFGYGVVSAIKMDTADLPDVSVPPASKYAFAYFDVPGSSDLNLYAAPVSEFGKDKPQIAWRKISGPGDSVSAFDVRGDELYLRTFKNAPHRKIIKTNINEPDLNKAELVYPESEEIVVWAGAARDALYVETRHGGVRKIYRLDYKTGRPAPLDLPYGGSASISELRADEDGIHFTMTSWTAAGAWFRYLPKTGNSQKIVLAAPLPGSDLVDVEAINVRAPSHDGVMVPMVIVQKKNLKRDGTNPVMLSAYGSYGDDRLQPFLARHLRPWFDRGGIVVFTGVRGGGEYGEEWRLAGKDAKKPNSWKDLIACAEYMVREKYSSAPHIGIFGGSAGGIVISNAISERPDLFGAAIIVVGVNNALRMETTANGIPNIGEWGTFKTEEGFRSLLAMDGYHNVKDGTKYPAVLLTHGINDPRVEPWMSAKMAARLQAATASEKPILLRIDYDAGHGIGSSVKQINELNAEIYAFLFQQLR